MKAILYPALGSALAAIVLLLCAGTARAQELTANQANLLRGAEAAQKTAETNLKAALDAAGPEGKEVPASRAKLALTRSASARAYVDAAVKAIEVLPASHPQVTALRAKLANTGKAIDALEKRLTSEPAPPKPDVPAGVKPEVPGGAKPAVPAAGAGMKLDYKQEKLLKDADFHLNDMEASVVVLSKLAEQVKAAATEPDRLNSTDLLRSAGAVERARSRKAIVDGYMKDLPLTGAGVPEAADRLAKATAAVDAAEQVIAPARERVKKMIDPAAYPALSDDVKRLRELGQMVGDTRAFEASPARAAEIVKQAPAAKEELVRVQKAYAPLLGQDVDAGRQVKAATEHLAAQLKAFDGATEEAKKSLPEQVKADLAKVNAMADEAVKEQKPLFFRGGIADLLKCAESKLALYAALDPEAAKPLQAALVDTGKQMKTKQASLRQLIIAENPLPPDRYAGPDKAALIAKAVATWKVEQPDAQVLATRIPSEQWEREPALRRQNATWYKEDRSRLQVQILVKQDDKLAVIRPVNLWMDHLKNDNITAFPLNGVKDELTPESYLMIEKIK